MCVVTVRAQAWLSSILIARAMAANSWSACCRRAMARRWRSRSRGSAAAWPCGIACSAAEATCSSSRHAARRSSMLTTECLSTTRCSSDMRSSSVGHARFFATWSATPSPSLPAQYSCTEALLFEDVCFGSGGRRLATTFTHVQKASYVVPIALVGVLAWLGKPSWWAVAMLTGGAKFSWDYLWGDRRVLDAAYDLRVAPSRNPWRCSCFRPRIGVGMSVGDFQAAPRDCAGERLSSTTFPSGIGIALYGLLIWSRAWSRQHEAERKDSSPPLSRHIAPAVRPRRELP
jgi:hypothetical protein